MGYPSGSCSASRRRRRLPYAERMRESALPWQRRSETPSSTTVRSSAFLVWSSVSTARPSTTPSIEQMTRCWRTVTSTASAPTWLRCCICNEFRAVSSSTHTPKASNASGKPPDRFPHLQTGKAHTNGRIDYFRNPSAPKANSVVPSVTAIVRDDSGRLLLIHKTDNDLWALPGGGHDIGERIGDTVVREVFEETGIQVEVDSIVGLYTDPEHVMAYDDGEVRQQFSICFRARPVGGSLRTSSESKEVRWVDPADLDGLEIHPSMMLRIRHGLDTSRAEPYIADRRSTPWPSVLRLAVQQRESPGGLRAE